MATRTMEQKQDRITTVLMAPFMSCGARLPVYVLFATAFWPMSGQNLVFGLYLIGILAAIATGFMLKRTALAGQTSAFVMEYPPENVGSFKELYLPCRQSDRRACRCSLFLEFLRYRRLFRQPRL